MYDPALSLLLAQLIRAVEEAAPEDRPAWWEERVEELRIFATTPDLLFELDGGGASAEREELAELLRQAANHLEQRGVFTAEDAAGWTVDGEATVMFRGGAAQATGPVAELGRALSDMLLGPLPAPPAGTMWVYGFPEGRTAVVVRNVAEDGLAGE